MKLSSVLSTLLVLDAALQKAGVMHPSKIVYQVFLRVAEADRDGERLSKMCLQNELGVFYTSIQAAVSSLRAEGLVTEVPDPEGGNRRHIGISTKGRALITKLFDEKASTELDRPKPTVASTPRKVDDVTSPDMLPTPAKPKVEEKPSAFASNTAKSLSKAPVKKPAAKAPAKPAAKKAPAKAPAKKVAAKAPAKTPAKIPAKIPAKASGKPLVEVFAKEAAKAEVKTPEPTPPAAKSPSNELSPAAKALLAKTAPTTPAAPIKPKVVFGKKAI